MTDTFRAKKMLVTELSKRNDLEWFSIKDGIDPKEVSYFVLGFAGVLMAAVGSGAFGWLFAVELLKNERYAWPLALGVGGLVGFTAALVILDYLITAAEPNYEAQMKGYPEAVTPGPALAPAAGRESRRLVVLTENDKELLRAFARRYPAVRSVAVNKWEGANSPFIFAWLGSKREGIERVQQLILRMDLGVRDGRGAIQTGPELEDRIPNWQNGIFEAETTPPQNRPSARV